MSERYLKRSWRQVKLISKDPLLFIVIIVILTSLILFILFPLFKVITASIFPQNSFSLSVLAEVIGSWYLRQAFYNSVMMGALTGFFGVAVGFIFAFTMARTNIPFKKFFHLIAIVPIISPPFIGALSIIMLFGNNGFISDTILHLTNVKIYGFRGLLFAQVLTFFPVAYIILRGVLESISPTLEDAALDLGGSRLKVFARATLPLAVPGIASAMLILFIETLADFGNPLILAGSKFPVLSVQAYLQITGMYDLPKGAALALMLLVPAFFSGLIYSFVRAMTAISAVIFLVSSSWSLMTVQIMSQVESGRLGAAAAFSVILVMIILAAIIVIRSILTLRYGRFGGTTLKF
ncbi:MAG TPA: iron ABC transporter permease [Spirochaetales bacterium]|nr:iron ABC transporter permease [Spirochaetales bacterium]